VSDGRNSAKDTAIEIIRGKYEGLSCCLNERSRRIWAATEARSLGWGGITLVHQATGIAAKTIRRGLTELTVHELLEDSRIRKTGGGRKKLTEKAKNLKEDLEALLEPVTRGDPETPLRWTCKSTHNLAKELKKKGYCISQPTVCTLLTELGYSLQANRKINEGGTHPDRNRQFRYINRKTKVFQRQHQPVISVDTKKKEKIGNFKNPGQEYHKKGQAPAVNVYDFIDKKKGKVAPYGVYDLSQNSGWVSVGVSSDTARFAVNSIRRWWNEMGRVTYPGARKLYITADCGGSNGNRNRLWKVELQTLANDLKLVIHVSHFPPGTSQWNKIEHRMFSFISKNWRGRPLVDRATVVNLIAHTKTETGLVIQAELDETIYEKGIKVPDKELAQVNLKRFKFHGEWNYKISPQRK
jgi:transposase